MNRGKIFGVTQWGSGPAFLAVVLMTLSPGQGTAQTWLQQTPAGTLPAPRTGQSAVFDSSGKMIVFGGFSAETVNGQLTNATFLNDAWILDLSTNQWTLVNSTGSAPAPRELQAAAYDGTNLIIFGGLSANAPFGFNDTWILHGVTSGSPAWTQVTASGGPSARLGASAVYDAAGSRVILFGGRSGNTFYNDVWALSNIGSSPTWASLSTSGTPPPARSAHSAVYNSSARTMTIFGGSGANGNDLNDTWVLDLSTKTWSQVTSTTAAPVPRDSHTAVFDASSGRMTVFGGVSVQGSNSTLLDDAWVLDTGTSQWFPICWSGISPNPRAGASAVFDSINRSMVLFGGDEQSNIVNDTWVLSNPTVSSSAQACPTSVNFGNQNILTRTAAKTITIVNSTASPLTISNPVFSGSAAADFTALNACPTPVPSNTSCVVTVFFDPLLMGMRNAALSVPGLSQTVSLSGTGIAAGFFQIFNRLSGKALDVIGASTADGAQIQQYTPSLFEQQQWQLVPTSIPGAYNILNLLSGLVIDGGDHANGTILQQWSSNGSPQQLWQLQPVDDVHYAIVDPGTDKAFDLTGASTDNGTKIQQWDQNNQWQQQWLLIPPYGSTITNRNSNMVLDVPGASDMDGTLIQQWDSDQQQQQQWRLIPEGEGYYGIMNVLSGKVLDVPGASTENGSNIQQWDLNNQWQQQWQLIPVSSGPFGVYYEIRNRFSGKALDVTNASTEHGMLIQQYDYNGGPQQQWLITP